MRFYWLLLVVLCVWRITHLLVSEDGPFDVVVRLRATAGDGFWGELLDCFYCMSVWVALPFAFFLGETWVQTLIHWPAISAGAIMLERLTDRPEYDAMPDFVEDKEENDVLLRTTKATTTNDAARLAAAPEGVRSRPASDAARQV